MANSDNGWLVLLGIAAGLAVVVGVLIGIAYAGMTLIIAVDYIASAFTWLGITSPIWGWLALGCVSGAFVGLIMGLKHVQRSPGVPVYAGAAVMTGLIFLGALYSKPVPIIETAEESITTKPIPNDSPSMYIDKISARIGSLRFFEGGHDAPQPSKRVYTSRFQKSKTRYVYWQLDYSFPPKQNRISFTISAYWYRSDGNLLGSQEMGAYVERGWNSAYSNSGWGWRRPGNWANGIYRVDLFVEGKKIASGQFQIY